MIFIALYGCKFFVGRIVKKIKISTNQIAANFEFYMERSRANFLFSLQGWRFSSRYQRKAIVK